MGGDESDSPDDFSDVDPDDEEDPEKKIQKLSGKLAYELRDFDDSEKYSDTAKFAMSMTIAALDSEKISDEDKSGIENKLEKQFNGGSDLGGEEDMSGEDMSGDDLGTDLDGGEEPVEEVVLFEFTESDKSMLDEYGMETPLLFDVEETNLNNAIPTKTGVPPEGEEMILFDDEPETRCGIMDNIPVDEDVYNSKPKAPKNKKFHTSIGDLTVGRIYGDDDATGIVESPEQKTKRNPFLYK